MKEKLFIPFMDNGSGSVTASNHFCMVLAALTALKERDCAIGRFSHPCPAATGNFATHQFLESNCDRMVIVDLDIMFTPAQLELLISHEVPIVAGVYPKKQLGLTLNMQVLDKNAFAENVEAQNANPLVEVEWVARGFMTIHRSVFEAMEHESPIVDIEGAIMREYWRTLPGGHSEDKEFCQHWRKLGGKILVDQRLCVQHEGSAVYPIPGTFKLKDDNQKAA